VALRKLGTNAGLLFLWVGSNNRGLLFFRWSQVVVSVMVEIEAGKVNLRWKGDLLQGSVDQ
jgi:hypothetical protein